MQEPAHVTGQAVLIRTDTPDYAEEMVPFSTLPEMIAICSEARPNLTLEKIIIYGRSDEGVCTLTLGFVSSTKSVRPENLQLAH